MYAHDYIHHQFTQMGLDAPAIHAHPTQAGRYRLLPAQPFNTMQLTMVSQHFDDVSPYDGGAEITVPDAYPPAPASPAEREWLTKEGTLDRRLEQVLIDHGLIDNVQSIGGVPGGLNYTVKFNGAAPGLPVNMKRGDLTQAGLMEMKVGGSPGTWSIRVSDQWRIEQQAGELLRQRDAEIRDLKARLETALDATSQAQDTAHKTYAKLLTARAERDDAEKLVVELRRERDQLETQITAPAMPKWAPLRSEIGYTMPRGCKLHIATSLAILNDLMGQGGKLIGQPRIISATELYAMVEMREGKAARLPNYAGRVTIVDTNRPYTMRRADRIDRDNAEVFREIRAVPRTPVQPITPLEVR